MRLAKDRGPTYAHCDMDRPVNVTQSFTMHSRMITGRYSIFLWLTRSQWGTWNQVISLRVIPLSKSTRLLFVRSCSCRPADCPNRQGMT